ncbi:hypothetical protein DV737_g1360, partial [Chaetothyriales sp. CBS 132003]
MRVMSGPKLAVAVSAAGGLGFIGPAVQTQKMRDDLEEARKLIKDTPKLGQEVVRVPTLPVGLGFQLWGDDLATATQLVREYQPCVAWLYAPKEDVKDFSHWSSEIRRASPKTAIWIQIGTVAEVQRLLEMPELPDAVVVQGAEAGGHGRADDGIGLITLLPEVADIVRNSGYKLTLIAAGGIADGRGVAAALCLGADGIALGTRFLAATEARIYRGYQQEVVRATDGGVSTTRTLLYNKLRGTVGWPKQYAPRTIINRSYIDHQNGVSFEELKVLHDASSTEGDSGALMDVERALLAKASIGSLIPVDGESALVKLLDNDAVYFETSTRMLPVKCRELLFVDEKVRCIAALQIPRCEQQVLDNLLSRAEFKIEVWAFDRPYHDEESITPVEPVKDLIVSTHALNIQDPVVLVQTRTVHDVEEEFLTLVWEAEIALHRPRIRMSEPSIYLHSLLVIEGPGTGSTEDEALLEPFTQMEPNVLEPMQQLAVFNGKPPYLAASRLERVTPTASMPRTPFRLEHMSPKYRLVPAANVRIRFSQLNSAAYATATIASLDLEITPLVEIEAVAEKVDMEIASGQIENLMPGFVPLKCRSGDLVTFLWRLKAAASGNLLARPTMANASMRIDILSISILLRLTTSDQCRSTVHMAWTTNVDFSPSLNASFGAPSQSLQRNHRPPGLSLAKERPKPVHYYSRTSLQPAKGPANVTISFTAADEPVYPGRPFTWHVLVVNHSAHTAKMTIVPLPRIPAAGTTSSHFQKRHAPQLSAASSHADERRHVRDAESEVEFAQAIVDGNVVYAAHHSNAAPPPADLISLTAELRIGPLPAGQCHETKLEMAAFKTGVLSVDAMRVIDNVREAEEGINAAGVLTDFRDLPDVIVEEEPVGFAGSPGLSMAALPNGPVPIVKVEDDMVKDEPMEDDAVPYMDDPDDEGGDLDFSGAKQEVWLGHVPRTLWAVLSKVGTMDDDDEIEIGTIRVEGPETRPQRVSLLLNANIAQFSTQHKEYNLFETPPAERRAKRKGGTLVFSEQDVAGYQPRRFNFNDVDEQGNPVQANSKLFEKWKRSQNNKKRRADKDGGAEDTPQSQRRKIPKKTAIQGVISREFDVKPVKNADYLAVEAAQTGSMLRQKKKQEAVLIQSLDDVIQIEGTADQLKQNRDAVKRRQIREREDRKANQYQRLERPALQSLLHQLFARHKVWPFKELRLETRQPADYLKGVLEEIAFQPAKGDWAGKWVMKEEYRNTHLADLQDFLMLGSKTPPDEGTRGASDRRFAPG